MSAQAGLFMVIAAGTLGIIIGRLLPRRAKIGDMAKERDYGHPRPPLSRLRSQLPKPPLGYLWETKVENNSAGEPELHLLMISAVTGEAPEGGISSNLIKGGRPWDTWAAYYRNYSHSVDSQLREMDSGFLGPLVDWANKLVYKYSTPEEYEIG